MAFYLASPTPFFLASPSSTLPTNKLTISTSCSGIINPNHLKFKLNVVKNRASGGRTTGKVEENSCGHDLFGGKLVQGKLIFQQNFLIKSYELGPDSKISIGALINLLQESALNHFISAGLVAEGFGSTPAMCLKNLIWVVYKMQIVVDSYPSWSDVVQVDTWTCASGRYGVRRDWLGRDYKTGKTLFRAVRLARKEEIVYVMMNKKTRKLSKFIEETREETKAVFMECDPIIIDDGRKLRDLDFDTADYVITDLSPNWTDLDVNQHVNHVKYIKWILESAPDSILETQKLCALKLEFRKECGKNSLVQSLSAISREAEGIELEHTLRLQNGARILRGRTLWMPRN
ncbi:palmitoyl-acyl carrier protein thioesterase, chloroplastic-like [Humulus lupulus]|uniref:palmitoyl-acyl carrier protein thioesterase, chloroplastic-like n=1 Tax=Humulus lupulus TaxID=3486 RepID=UPI002B402071|nr:palmitoyl-acyl carrier protein thioesterase, chloroplastic-like [Humulus lupulus]